MIWDDHTGRLATLPMMLPPTTLLGRDLPHRGRRFLKNLAHFDDALFKCRGRQLKVWKPGQGIRGMYKKPKALAESTNSGQGGTPEKPQVQERALANERVPHLIRQRMQRPIFVL